MVAMVRFTGIATVFGNMTATITVAVYSDGLSPLMVLAPLQRHAGQALWVILASIGLYLTGMLWNDIADSERDQRLHPNRPLPADAVNRSAVWMVGLFLPLLPCWRQPSVVGEGFQKCRYRINMGPFCTI